MENKKDKNITNKKNILNNTAPPVIIFTVLGSFLVYGLMQISTLTKQVDYLTTELSSTTLKLSQNTTKLSQNLNDLRTKNTELSNNLSNTQKNIDDVKTQVGGVKQTIGSISGEVGDIQKLAKIDPELLKKYSDIYFMNENYTPAHLISIPNAHLYNESIPQQFLTEAWPHLQKMFIEAKSSDIVIYINSAYRSFGEQQALKGLFTVVFGADSANSFSADQGYSEHQLGTAVDFITTGLNGQVEGFENTDSYTWLLDNAHRFGFILSYPENNEHFIFEPWHWRFVGTKLATHLYNSKLEFYEMDQREVGEYLIDIFD